MSKNNEAATSAETSQYSRSELLRRFGVATRLTLSGPTRNDLLQQNNVIFGAGPAPVGDLRDSITAAACIGGRNVIYAEFAPGPADMGPSRFHVAIPFGSEYVWLDNCGLWCSDALSEIVLVDRTGKFPYMLGSRGGELTWITGRPGSPANGQDQAMTRLRTICRNLTEKHLSDTVDVPLPA